MAIFQYQALTGGGRLMKGTIEAASVEQAQQILDEMHLQDAVLSSALPPPPRSRVGRAELLLFNQQLASIARAGVPLDRGLREVADDVQKASLRKVINEIADDLQAGVSVEEAFRRRQGLFPPLYGHIVRAGVQSGRLAEMLTSLNRHLEMEGQTRRILVEATTYPAVVLSIAAILLTAIFTLVIPAFRPIFRDMGVGLPVLTRFFLDLADHVLPFWLGVATVVAAFVALLTILSRSPAAGGSRSRSISTSRYWEGSTTAA